MQLKHYTSLLFVILTISACKQGNEPLNEDLTKLNDKLTFELNGTFNMPEWVDLESDKEGQAKAFTLRHNDKGYPKIRLSGIEDEGLAFEAFPSSVWLYTPSNSYNFRIDVEDHGQADPTISGTNKSYGTGPNNRGVSRIIKRGLSTLSDMPIYRRRKDGAGGSVKTMYLCPRRLSLNSWD